MGAYQGFGQATCTAAETLVQVKQPSTALKRLKIGYVQIGSDASADSAYEANLQKTTNGGTPGSTFTPIARDPADGAASAVFNINHSAEPTYTSGAVHLPIFAHQRATFQWYAAPGHEIVIPVTNDAGVGLLMVTAATAFNMGSSLEWEE